MYVLKNYDSQLKNQPVIFDEEVDNLTFLSPLVKAHTRISEGEVTVVQPNKHSDISPLFQYFFLI